VHYWPAGEDHNISKKHTGSFSTGSGNQA